MITDAILDLIHASLLSLVRILPHSPDVLQLGQVGDFIRNIASWIAPFDKILPIHEAIVFVGSFFVVLSAYFTAWLVNRIINLIRGAG